MREDVATKGKVTNLNTYKNKYKPIGKYSSEEVEFISNFDERFISSGQDIKSYILANGNKLGEETIADLYLKRFRGYGIEDIGRKNVDLFSYVTGVRTSDNKSSASVTYENLIKSFIKNGNYKANRDTVLDIRRSERARVNNVTIDTEFGKEVMRKMKEKGYEVNPKLLGGTHKAYYYVLEHLTYDETITNKDRELADESVIEKIIASFKRYPNVFIHTTNTNTNTNTKEEKKPSKKPTIEHSNTNSTATDSATKTPTEGTYNSIGNYSAAEVEMISNLDTRFIESGKTIEDYIASNGETIGEEMIIDMFLRKYRGFSLDAVGRDNFKHFGRISGGRYFEGKGIEKPTENYINLVGLLIKDGNYKKNKGAVLSKIRKRERDRIKYIYLKDIEDLTNKVTKRLKQEGYKVNPRLIDAKHDEKFFIGEQIMYDERISKEDRANYNAETIENIVETFKDYPKLFINTTPVKANTKEKMSEKSQANVTEEKSIKYVHPPKLTPEEEKAKRERLLKKRQAILAEKLKKEQEKQLALNAEKEKKLKQEKAAKRVKSVVHNSTEILGTLKHLSEKIESHLTPQDVEKYYRMRRIVVHLSKNNVLKVLSMDKESTSVKGTLVEFDGKEGTERIFIHPRYIVNVTVPRIYVDRLGKLKLTSRHRTTPIEMANKKYILKFMSIVKERKERNRFEKEHKVVDRKRMQRLNFLIGTTYNEHRLHLGLQKQMVQDKKGNPILRIGVKSGNEYLLTADYIYDRTHRVFLYKRKRAASTLKPFVQEVIKNPRPYLAHMQKGEFKFITHVLLEAFNLRKVIRDEKGQKI